jgi:hypothetical protein
MFKKKILYAFETALKMREASKNEETWKKIRTTVRDKARCSTRFETLENFLKLLNFNLTESIFFISHGIPNIANTDVAFLRVFWLICILASSSGCWYLSAKSFANFFKNEVVTTITVVNEIPSEFFMVSFCDKNIFATEAGIEYSRANTEQFEREALDVDDPEYQNITMHDPNGYAFFHWLVMTSLWNVSDSVKKSFSLSFDDMVLTCVFNSRECTSSDFVWYFDTNLGKFIINSNISTSFSTTNANVKAIVFVLIHQKVARIRWLPNNQEA